MCDILFGDGFIDTHPVVTGNCNGNSPLVWDETMLGAMRAFNRRNQPVLCSPFVLGGANTPASTAAPAGGRGEPVGGGRRSHRASGPAPR